MPDWFVEVGFRPGVTDNEARTARDTAALVLNVPRDSVRVYTAVQYASAMIRAAPLNRGQVEALSRDLLCNTLIQRFRIKSLEEWRAEPGFAPQAALVTGASNDTVETVALSRWTTLPCSKPAVKTPGRSISTNCTASGHSSLILPRSPAARP